MALKAGIRLSEQGGRFSIMKNAYSDLINHAFHYAAVHHDGDTRKQQRIPFITHPAHMALILARYGRDDETIVAALLHDVVEDCGKHSPEHHARQIGEKFGATVLADVLAVTNPSELHGAAKRAGYIENLKNASERAQWVCAADKIHNARSIISDLKRAADPNDIWGRFRATKEESVAFYGDVYARLKELGFVGAIMPELEATVRELREVSGK